MAVIKNKSLSDPLTQLTLAVIVFVIATILSKQEGSLAWERWLFNFIYNLPEILTPLFSWVTHFGSFYMLIVLALLYLARKHYHVVIRLLMSGSMAYLLAGVAKDLLGRPRPIELFSDVVYRDFLVRGPGFPSGHTALATALGLTLAHALPRKYSWIAPVLIIGVAISRVHLGVHAPLDVVGGLGIGWASYALFRNVNVSDNKSVKRTKAGSGKAKKKRR